MLQSLYAIVDSITFQQIIFQNTVGPLAIFHTSIRFHSIANREYHIQIIEFLGTIYHTTTLFLNYRKFCDSCHPFKLFTQCIVDMFAYGFDIPVEQIC